MIFQVAKINTLPLIESFARDGQKIVVFDLILIQEIHTYLEKKALKMYQFCLELKKNPCKGEIPLANPPKAAAS